MTKQKLQPIHPGEILMEEFLKPMEISQYKLAKDISVPARRINEIVQGKRSVTHKPGVKEPMHSHPAYVSVYLSTTRVKVTTPDGKTVEKDRKAGEVAYSGPTTHALENIGTADQHVIVIELKK